MVIGCTEGAHLARSGAGFGGPEPNATIAKVATVMTMNAIANSPVDRPKVGHQRDPQKSRITNGSALLPGIDGRSPWVRRCKDVIAAHLSDLGGADNTSAAERSIIRRASTLTVELERLEAKFATAGAANPDDLDLYQRTAGNLRRLLEAVGLQRRQRTVMSLSEYIAAIRTIRRERRPQRYGRLHPAARFEVEP